MPQQGNRIILARSRAAGIVAEYRRYLRPAIDADATVAELAAARVAALEAQGRASDDHASVYSLHIVPMFGSRRPSEIEMPEVEAWALTVGRHYSPNYAHKILSLFRALLESARVEKLTTHNAADIPRGTLPPKSTLPGYRPDLDVPTTDEIVRIILDPANPEWRRVYWAVGYLGLRMPGEGSGLQIKSYDPTRRPLARMVVSRAWISKSRKFGPTKTRVPKEHPIPELFAAEVFDPWIASGYERTFGFKPGPEDLFCPRPLRRGTPSVQTETIALEEFRAGLVALGLRPRTLRSMRHSFFTLARKACGDREAIRRITHPRKQDRDASKAYDHYDWAYLCECVGRLHFARPIAARGGSMVSDAYRAAFAAAVEAGHKRTSDGAVWFTVDRGFGPTTGLLYPPEHDDAAELSAAAGDEHYAELLRLLRGTK